MLVFTEQINSSPWFLFFSGKKTQNNNNKKTYQQTKLPKYIATSGTKTKKKAVPLPSSDMA